MGFLLFQLGPRYTLASPPEPASRVFVYNYCYYTVPFLAGINWTHLQRFF